MKAEEAIVAIKAEMLAVRDQCDLYGCIDHERARAIAPTLYHVLDEQLIARIIDDECYVDFPGRLYTE